MGDFYRDQGCKKALRALGLKVGSSPEMGDALYQPLSAATGDEGKSRGRSHEAPYAGAATAMEETDRHVLRDPADASTTYPVGSSQSKVAVSLEETAAKSPVPVRQHPAAASAGGGFFVPGEDSFIGHDGEDAGTLAHEIGHAEEESLPGWRHLQGAPARAAHMASPFAAFGVARFAPKHKIKGGLAAATALSAPTLINEYRASRAGRDLLEGMGADEEYLDNYQSDMNKNLASYAAVPALAAVAAPLGKYLPKVAAAHKLHGRRKFRGLNLSIENRKGSYRHWYDPHEDRKGKTKQLHPYGYIRMSKGMDGDHVDCYLGPDEKATHVYVITTNKAPEFKTEDEQKCMLGFASAKAAKEAFLAHFDDTRFFRSMKSLPYAKFEEKVLGTRKSKVKKIASNMNEADLQNLIQGGPGSFEGQTPGDNLALPKSSLVGMRQVVGDGMEVSDKVDRQFRHMDEPMGTLALEGNSAALPESPGV